MVSFDDHLDIEEVNQAGQLIAQYVGRKTELGDTQRIDVLVGPPSERNISWHSELTARKVPDDSASFSKSLLAAFLPAGYPHSVTPDYLPYQIYDSLQAFSSSIAGLLASRAVLEGVGVGNADASPTAAVMLSILQDTMGRAVTILFAHRAGTSLEPECKKYRLAADVFNDGAMILDCVSPALPKAARIVVLSLASVLRALCGVAAGSAKASLSAHFATQGNLGELNALDASVYIKAHDDQKDSSQETIIGLLGMGFGSLVIPHIDTMLKTWFSLLVLLFVHLGTNYLAVRAVCMKTLNRQRANIVFTTYLGSEYPMVDKSRSIGTTNIVLSPTSVSKLEHVFEIDGVLRWDGKVLGHCIMGASLKQVFGQFATRETDTKTGSLHTQDMMFSELLNVFADEDYVLSYNRPRKRILIALKHTASSRTQLKAWLHALLLSREWTSAEAGSTDAIFRNHLVTLILVRRRVEEIWRILMPLLGQQGWDLETGALETKPKTRFFTRL